jgi:hypothetical protein
MYVCYNLYACACGCGWVMLLLLMMVVLRMAVRSETSERGGRPTSKPAAAQISRLPGPRQARGRQERRRLQGKGAARCRCRTVGSQREVTRREGTILPLSLPCRAISSTSKAKARAA